MMPRHDASELATRLGREAEAVCRHYLSSGHRAGRYWLVGDVQNTPGRSMFVRLAGPESGKGAAGKWTDYVAADVMLRRCSRAWLHQHSSVFTQHNLRVWGCA
ncbi:MAG: hypothetical protein ACRCV5_12605 [Afipia sp.]